MAATRQPRGENGGLRPDDEIHLAHALDAQRPRRGPSVGRRRTLPGGHPTGESFVRQGFQDAEAEILQLSSYEAEAQAVGQWNGVGQRLSSQGPGLDVRRPLAGRGGFQDARSLGQGADPGTETFGGARRRPTVARRRTPRNVPDARGFGFRDGRLTRLDRATCHHRSSLPASRLIIRACAVLFRGRGAAARQGRGKGGQRLRRATGMRERSREAGWERRLANSYEPATTRARAGWPGFARRPARASGATGSRAPRRCGR